MKQLSALAALALLTTLGLVGCGPDPAPRRISEVNDETYCGSSGGHAYSYFYTGSGVNEEEWRVYDSAESAMAHAMVDNCRNARDNGGNVMACCD